MKPRNLRGKLSMRQRPVDEVSLETSSLCGTPQRGLFSYRVGLRSTRGVSNMELGITVATAQIYQTDGSR